MSSSSDLDLDAALDRLRQRGTENVGGVVPRRNEELAVNPRLRFIDRIGHRLNGGIGVAEQSMADARHTRQITRGRFRRNRLSTPTGISVSGWQVRNLSSTFGDHLVGLGLDPGSPAPHERAADQQKDH